MQKERGFILVLYSLGEWRTPISRTASSFCHGKSPTIFSKAKTKASVQSSCYILFYLFFLSIVFYFFEKIIGGRGRKTGSHQSLPKFMRLCKSVCSFPEAWPACPRRFHVEGCGFLLSQSSLSGDDNYRVRSGHVC